MDEQQFMAFDFKGTEKSKWPSLSFPQKQRVGPDLTDFDIPILKKFGDPMACIDGPLAQTDIDNFTFRYWFNYFYEEGAESDEINQALVTAALKLLFQRQKFPIPPKDQFTVPDKLKEYYKLRAATDADRCEALLKLLKAGYVGMRRFIGPLQEGLSNLPFMEEIFVHNKQQTRLFTRGEGQTDDFKREIYWRGESRSPEMLLVQATKRAVDIPSLVSKMNMDKTWNPFHLREVSENIWYRKAKNTDNDYYTAISVALNFKTACCFPLFDEKRVYNFVSFNPWDWSIPERTKQFLNLGVVVVNGKRRLNIVTKTTVYLSTNRGAKVFTRATQEKLSNTDAFPEHGVAEILPEDIYGYLVIYRAMHGLNKEAGFTVFIDKAASSRVRLAGDKMQKVGAPDNDRDKAQYGEIHTQLEREYQAALAMTPFAVAWAAGGYANMPAQFTELRQKPPIDGMARGFVLNGMKKPSDWV
ncbi:hypothetical protein [Roseiarcus sp.]|uniref:hypothetical protein n=1 Tax=Roseiarcus sp. TaxID=1969460 RepID=UPI003F9D51E3